MSFGARHTIEVGFLLKVEGRKRLLHSIGVIIQQI